MGLWDEQGTDHIQEIGARGRAGMARGSTRSNFVQAHKDTNFKVKFGPKKPKKNRGNI
jgi:hypothetical protein